MLFSTMIALVEATHVAAKLGERLAGVGRWAGKRVGVADAAGAGGRGGWAAGRDGEWRQEGDSDPEGEGAGAPGAAAKSRDTPPRADDSAFDLSGWVCELEHPTVVQGCVSLLRHYQQTSPKTLYYACHLLRRLASEPNDFAGTDPATGKPLTWISLQYHVSVCEVASALLNDPLVASSPELAEVREWARWFSASFLSAAAENPLVFVEALFWRHEKTANADLMRHYGVIDGRVAKWEEDRYLAGVPGKHGGGAGGSGSGRVTKAQAAANEAAAEALRTAAAAAAADEDGEAQWVDGSDNSGGSDSEGGRAGRPPARKRGRRGAGRAGASARAAGKASPTHTR